MAAARAWAAVSPWLGGIADNPRTIRGAGVVLEGLAERGTPVQRRTRDEIETSSRLCLNADLALLVVRFAAVKCVAADLRSRISNSRLDLMEITCQS